MEISDQDASRKEDEDVPASPRTPPTPRVNRRNDTAADDQDARHRGDTAGSLDWMDDPRGQPPAAAPQRSSIDDTEDSKVISVQGGASYVSEAPSNRRMSASNLTASESTSSVQVHKVERLNASGPSCVLLSFFAHHHRVLFWSCVFVYR